MQKIRYFDFYADEWIAGTAGLSLEDEGLYIRICALIYSHGGPINYELLKRSCSHDHGNKVRACLDHLVALHKVVRNGSEIDQKRCGNELEKARKRAGNGRENAAKRWKTKNLENATPSTLTNANPNYQPERKKDLAPKELNPVFLSSRESSTPLPSQGDGAAASRSPTTKEVQVSSDDLITPEQRAAGLAELHRALDAARRKAASLNGHAEAAE